MSKIVYVAEKRSFGGMAFEDVCNSLDNLKYCILQHEHEVYWPDDEKIPYSEELAWECIKIGKYRLHKVNLHDEEEIVFHEYDGASWFTIEKKNFKLLSRCKQIYPVMKTMEDYRKEVGLQ